MFEIDRSAGLGQHRLRSTAPLSGFDFDEIARQLGTPSFEARKVGFVAARQASSLEKVETSWNGRETSNVAEVGDWIATNMSPDRKALRDRDGRTNTYVIKAQTFLELYEPADIQSTFGPLYKAVGTVRAVALPGGFDIAAPWGERQVAEAGYLIRNGADVYGNHAETFEATYEPVS